MGRDGPHTPPTSPRRGLAQAGLQRIMPEPQAGPDPSPGSPEETAALRVRPAGPPPHQTSLRGWGGATLSGPQDVTNSCGMRCRRRTLGLGLGLRPTVLRSTAFPRKARAVRRCPPSRARPRPPRAPPSVSALL